MLYVTGDCHADWHRFTLSEFPEQKELTRDDFVIVCGDFGIWHKNKKEDWWIPIHKDEVLVVYDREDDFLVLPERIFNKHYRFVV